MEFDFTQGLLASPGTRTPATRKLRESTGAARPPLLEGPALCTPLQGALGAPWPGEEAEVGRGQKERA